MIHLRPYIVVKLQEEIQVEKVHFLGLDANLLTVFEMGSSPKRRERTGKNVARRRGRRRIGGLERRTGDALTAAVPEDERRHFHQSRNDAIEHHLAAGHVVDVGSAADFHLRYCASPQAEPTNRQSGQPNRVVTSTRQLRDATVRRRKICDIPRFSLLVLQGRCGLLCGICC